MAEDSSNISRRSLLGGAALAAAAFAASAEAQTKKSADPLLPGELPATTPGKAEQPTVCASGGGGFFPQPWEKKSLMPEYLFAQSPAKTPKICWLGPASGESAANYEQFARGFENYNCTVRHFNIFQPETLDFVDYLMGMDIIFVGGGSTRNLMALWREWGFDKALHTAWANGVVMSGGSAGLICWFQGGLTDSYPPVLAPVKGTGILPGSANPHHNVRPDRPALFRKFIADGSLESPGLSMENDTMALFHGTELVEIVSSRKEARAWRLYRTVSGFEEEEMKVRYLG